ncbi:MAG TPA: tRNA uridine-5-carboxymethylaminomethyl(34) synthesis GTPase MnmE [Allosphingosinicella sp.]|nr:tRNA uridine-5-carboxymethylaminomethyl(34) synthesis GTPase MnmE [Allosphingosinicella sp.]
MTRAAADTIFALSSGQPPAAIAIVRVSGPAAGMALEALSGKLPRPRHPAVAELKDPSSGELLDQALILFFPGPGSSTGEDVAEFHLHGGRSVVAGVLKVLEELQGFRAAAPGEFTRRAFENGRIDLAEAEGLADLLSAETDSQRKAALMLAGGTLSRKVEEWQMILLGLSAQLESALDFSDEGDVEEDLPSNWNQALQALQADMHSLLARRPAERLRDGVRVVIAGPPNAGKSTLLNALAGREAAITSAIPGTTRDVIEVPAAIRGTPFLLMDTAGLRDSEDSVEAIGIERARQSVEAADLVLWLGEPEHAPTGVELIKVEAKSDLPGRRQGSGGVPVSAVTGEGIAELTAMLAQRARELLPKESELAINARHRLHLGDCATHLAAAGESGDLLISSEELRQARAALDRITGRAGVEDMLDALFGTFCIGK